jgi:hypothetical protein
MTAIANALRAIDAGRVYTSALTKTAGRGASLPVEALLVAAQNGDVLRVGAVIEHIAAIIADLDAKETTP